MLHLQDIFKIKTQNDFKNIALTVFKFQFENNPVYRAFCDLLYKHPSDIQTVEDIPFLPIQFFKTHTVLSTQKKSNKLFTSSGTTGAQVSKHYVTDVALYERSFLKGFKRIYGDLTDYTVLALLPSYLERGGSSLVYMVDTLIKKSNKKNSGFYLNNLNALTKTLKTLDNSGEKTLLIGVSYALLDLIDIAQFNLKNTIIMETGGMKGKRKELVKEALHTQLKKGFGVDVIHSEYGMTELLSQAYSKGNGVFETPPWMQVITREPEDPLTLQTSKKTGGINVIDLANFYSCAFIATQDLGKVHNKTHFEILGRFDHSAIRGCNLMVI